MFVIPIRDQFLIYAPLHHLAALVNRTAALELADYFRSGQPIHQEQLGDLADLLQNTPVSEPAARQGPVIPSALGLLPTRSCNLGCRYCGFLSPDGTTRMMPHEMARDAVNWYMDTVQQHQVPHAEVHFFGGEPFCVEEVIDLAVTLAERRAAEIGCTIRFEVATNGTFSEARCHWVAEHIHSVVLSFDGPADIQNLHRPLKSGMGAFDTIYRNAKILSETGAGLCLRSCITQATVHRMPEIAAWFCEEFRPRAVSFEPLQATVWSESAGLAEPDPWLFAENYIAAARILEAHGIQPIYAAAEIDNCRVTFCPVGRDFVIVSPDGTLSACYLLERDWQAQNLDLRIGQMNGQIHFDREQVEAVRELNVLNKSFCDTCFCKWHCAGGCHVNHSVAGNQPGDFDRLCIQTRIITLYNILRAMGRDDLALAWLQNRDALEQSIWQRSDQLVDVGNTL